MVLCSQKVFSTRVCPEDFSKKKIFPAAWFGMKIFRRPVIHTGVTIGAFEIAGIASTRLAKKPKKSKLLFPSWSKTYF